MRLISPVLGKELGQIACSRKSLVLKSLFLGILMTFYLLILSNMGSIGSGLEVFGMVSFVLLSCVVLFTPLVTAGVITGEKQAGTLGLLFITRLSALNIVQDKGLSRITYMIYIAMLTFPFMFGSLLYGGIEAQQIISVMGNVLGAILFCGGLSLLASTLFKKFSAALAVVYTAQLCWFLLIPILYAVTADNTGLDERYMAALNPFFGTAMILNPNQMGSSTWLSYAWMYNLGFGALVYLVSIAISAMMLRRIAFAGNESKQKVKGPSSRLGKLLPSSWFQRGDTPGRNPMIWKESNLLNDHLRKVLVVLAVLMFLIYLVVLATSGVFDWGNNQQEGFHAFVYGLAFCITGIYTILLASSSFSRERESRTFDILLSTRLSGRQIVAGMFWGNIRSLMLFFVMTATIAAVGAFSFDHPLGVVWALVNIAVYLGGLVILCMYLSLTMRSTAKAIGFAFGIVLAIFFLPLLLGIMSQDGDVIQAMFALTPEAWVISTYLPHDSFMDEIGGYAAYLVITAVYEVIAAAIWINMSEQFDRIVGRQESDRSSPPVPVEAETS